LYTLNKNINNKGVKVLRRLRKRKAQANIGEYVLIMFVTIGFISAISLYVRRALQARIYDARNLIKNADCFGCVNIPGGKAFAPVNMLGNIDIQYEPYYTLAVSNRTAQYDGDAELAKDTTTGQFYKRSFNSTGIADSVSLTLPPPSGYNPKDIDITEIERQLSNQVFIK
jgi:hypothetical protein